jgi:hypothetical protein
MSFRCQANKVSGVTSVATSARSFRPSPLALAANRRRWSSVNRTRRPPSCSRSTRVCSQNLVGPEKCPAMLYGRGTDLTQGLPTV